MQGDAMEMQIVLLNRGGHGRIRRGDMHLITRVPRRQGQRQTMRQEERRIIDDEQYLPIACTPFDHDTLQITENHGARKRYSARKSEHNAIHGDLMTRPQHDFKIRNQ